MKTKICRNCKEKLSTNVFVKNKRSPDGLHWWCKNCRTIYRKYSYQSSRRDYLLCKDRKWQNEHKEIFKAWRKKNAVKRQQYDKKWKKNNPEKVTLYNCKRSHYLKVYQPLWFEKELVKQVYLKRDELNRLWKRQFEVDHIIPIISKKVCGLHCWANLQLLDCELNRNKHGKFETNW